MLHLLSVLALFSCEEFCEESARTAVAAKFYVDGNETAVSNLTIQGLRNDSVLYRNVSRKDVLLPLNPTSDTTAYLMKVGDAPADTVTIVYSRHAAFISAKCGCAGFADITEKPAHTLHLIKMIEIVNPSVGQVSYRENVVNAENIRIIY
ncbi:MAG: hypothetical protein LBF89_09415 [Bacteroidales bacterium]|nr:hypothetical protein [Bacteroidales bacterium]